MHMSSATQHRALPSTSHVKNAAACEKKVALVPVTICNAKGPASGSLPSNKDHRPNDSYVCFVRAQTATQYAMPKVRPTVMCVSSGPRLQHKKKKICNANGSASAH